MKSAPLCALLAPIVVLSLFNCGFAFDPHGVYRLPAVEHASFNRPDPVIEPGPMPPSHTQPAPDANPPIFIQPYPSGIERPGFRSFPGSCCDSKWFASVGAMIMTRGNDDHFFYSCYDNAEPVMDVRETNMDWEGGAELRVGKFLHGCCMAVELSYWGIYPDDQESVRLGVVGRSLNGLLPFANLQINPGGGVVAANVLTENAEIQRVRREFDIHNLELNLVKWPCCCSSSVGCGGKCGGGQRQVSVIKNRFHWITGIRYFRYEENIEFGSDVVDRTFNGGPEEIFYNSDVENDLIGLQLGCEGEICYGCWTFFGGTKWGVYNNHIQRRARVGTANAVAEANNTPIDFEVDTNDVAFLGEGNFGATWHHSPCLSATLGYRAVTVCGVAMPTDQAYLDFQGIAAVQSNRCLLLHGAFARVEVTF